MNNSAPKSQIYGVDFSGAKDACKKIWICESTPTNNGLLIDKCWSIKEKYGKLSLYESLETLINFIGNKPDSVFGLDFPFGLPGCLLCETEWEAFMSRFHAHYKDPDQFFKETHNITEGKEPKRLTDKKTGAPFGVNNLKLYKQTYYGINNVLYSLLKDNSASILPMQKPDPSKTWVIEICPASTLKAKKIYSVGFKKMGKEAEEIRATILDSLIEKKLVREFTQNARMDALENSDGDALDSIIAAAATYRGLRKNFTVSDNELYKLEGYIYV